jgi:parvulin-like peptidyl-prolyl isomerase
MAILRLVPLFILAVLLLVGCGQGDVDSNSPDPDVVASFSGGVITKDQLGARFDGLMPCCKGRYEGVEGSRELIKEMVLPVVISKAIKQKKIDLRGNLREELGNISDELNMSFLHMKLHEEILENNEKYEGLRESYEFQRRRLEGYPLSERFQRLVQLHKRIHPQLGEDVKKATEEHIRTLHREAAVTKNYDVLRVQVTDDELRDFYEKHEEGLHSHEYRVPDRVRVQEITIEIDKSKEECPKCSEEEKVKELADDALMELRSGAEFQTVAQKYSSDGQGSAESRWIERGSMGKAFEDRVFDLEVGEISEVLKDGDSVRIVRGLEQQPGYFRPFEEIRHELTREYHWQKAEDYLEENSDRIVFSINATPYTIGDLISEYQRNTPEHECHHMEGMDQTREEEVPAQLCDFSHNDLEEQRKMIDRMIDKELLIEDTYDQMIHVEHQEEIEFLTMASLYPLFHGEEMEKLIQITDDMVEDHFRENKKDYKYPGTAKINLIVVRGGKTEEEKNGAFQKATKAHGELRPSFFSFRKAKDFAEVAQEYSEDQETASRGGRLEIDIAECRNEVEYMLFHGFHKEIFNLKPGEISEVFEYGNDYYIVQIRELEERKQIDFEEVKTAVRGDLHNKEHQKVMESWENDLLESEGFIVYDQALEDMLAEASAGAEASQKPRGS